MKVSAGFPISAEWGPGANLPPLRSAGPHRAGRDGTLQRLDSEVRVFATREGAWRMRKYLET